MRGGRIENQIAKEMKRSANMCGADPGPTSRNNSIKKSFET
jgi:hypothetical protein